MYVWIHDKYSSTSFKQRLSGLWQTEIWFWYNKANFSNHVCHCGAVVKELLVRADKPRLQNSPYFYVFKHARAVKQKVCNEAENRERDWGESLFFSPFFLSPHTPVRACEARALRARKTLTLRFTVFFTDFEKKNRLSLQSKINRVRLPCCCFLFLCTVFFFCLVFVFKHYFSFWPVFLYSYCWPCWSCTVINIYFTFKSGVLFWKRDFKTALDLHAGQAYGQKKT